MAGDGASSSAAPAVGQHPEIKQVNESLYELYKPPGTPHLQIVFFHGVQLDNYANAHLSTWTSADGSCVWPQKWLVEEFPHAHVLTVSYSGAIERRGQVSMGMFNIGENLVSDLMDCNIGQRPYCPVILVGHSFGGLVIKEVCSQAHHSLTKLSQGREREKLQMFLDNVGGIFFYATPHHGSDHAGKLTNRINDPLLPFFNTFSAAGARLNQEFNDICALHEKWRIAGLGEGLPTLLRRNWGPDEEIIIVPEASARVLNFNLMENDDHFSISKPKEKIGRTFYKLKNFVADIDNDKKDIHQCQGLPSHSVDLEKRSLDVQQKLQVPIVLGIVGMGGIGKTTLAKQVFNSISREFEYTCFVENVKGIPIRKLQKSVLASFYKHGRQIDSSTLSWLDLKRKKTLIAMDDVGSEMQLKDVPELKDFGDGSRVIITTRDESIFSCLKSYHLYKVDFLEPEQAENLFCQYAELEEVLYSPPWRESKVKEVVKKCGGLPLTLEVLGCYLRGHVDDPKFWEQTITKLGKGEAIGGNRNDRVWETLRVSYDGLARKEQKMFIEAAIYFFEQPLDRALAAWSGANEGADTTCANLMSRSMMKVVSKKEYNGLELKTVWVHEQLRDLASGVAKKIHYMVPKSIANMGDMEEGVDLLNSDEVDGNTKIVRLVQPWHNIWKYKMRFFLLDPYPSPTGMRHDHEIKLDFLEKLTKLKCLDIEGVLPTGPLRKFPRKLSLLHWEVPSVRSPPLFPQIRHKELGNLAVLELEGWEVAKEFPEELGKLTNLRILSLRWLRGLDHLPENLGNLSLLKQLTLIDLDLRRLPESLGDLLLLEELDLDLELKSLPTSICQLQALKRLKISSGSLEMLPNSLGELASLQHLDIECEKLKALPDTLGDLVRLVHFKLHAERVEALPKTLGHLVRLEHLELEAPRAKEGLETVGQLAGLRYLRIQDSGVACLPESFGELSSLQLLSMRSCRNLKKLPDSFGNLCALEHLTIHLDNLEELPENLGQLSHLQTLDITLQCLNLPISMGQLSAIRRLCIDCPLLKTLPESLGDLSSLESLELKADSLVSIPESIGRLCSLTNLKIHAGSLRSIPISMGTLSSLQNLNIHCGNLETLPESLGDLSSLKTLHVKARSLVSIPECTGRLVCLTDLTIYSEILTSLPIRMGQLSLLEALEVHCNCLETLPCLGDLSSLKSLTLKVRSLVSILESIGQLSSLTHLSIHSESLRNLPTSFCELSALQTLELACDNLEYLPDCLGHFSLLQTLKLQAKCLKSIPETTAQLRSVRNFTIASEHLRNLPANLGQLSALQSLRIACPHLEVLPDIFGNMCSLEELKVKSKCLVIVPESIGELNLLTKLTIESESLTNLPSSLGNLSALEELQLHCDSLRTLPDGLGNLSALKELQLHCDSLRTLPDGLGNLSALKELQVHCDSLRTLPDGLGNLSSLERLDIRARSLVSMPESTGQLFSLDYLHITLANIRNLPSSFGKLSKLRVLQVKCDLLMKLPDIFGGLSSLRWLDIQENSLDRFQEQRLASLGWRLVRGKRVPPPRGLSNSLLNCTPLAWIRGESHTQSHALLKFTRNL